MALRLSCSVCGGGVVADDARKRRSLVVCSSCGAILPVAPDGTEPARRRRAPSSTRANLRLSRNGRRGVSIRVRRAPGAWAVNGWSRLAGLVSGTALGSVAFWWGGALFGLAGLPAALAGYVAAARLQPWLPPLTLQDGSLTPSSDGAEPVRVESIRQIYAAVTRADLGKHGSFTTASVYALTLDGTRVSLMDPVADEETAPPGRGPSGKGARPLRPPRIRRQP